MQIQTSGPITLERFTGSLPATVPLQIPPPQSGTNISLITHPIYEEKIADWEKWRLVYEAGEKFIQTYTKMFSQREDPVDFTRRKSITPIPAFAKSAINEIKNAIATRLTDVVRRGGTISYQEAIKGNLGGVDRKGSTLNWFIQESVIPELLVISKVGVFEDNYKLSSDESLRSQDGKHPYFYKYRAEDIRSWAYSETGKLQSVLLRDYRYRIDPTTTLPTGELERFRFLWLEDGVVHVQFFDNVGVPDGDEIILDLEAIPFHIFEISDSIMKDIANHQIALLNLESSDISFLLKGNIAFYTEQYDANDNSPYLKSAQTAYLQQQTPVNADGTPVVPGQAGYITDAFGITHATLGSSTPNSQSVEVLAGPSEGRRYPKGANTPSFIGPPTATVEASMKKQEALKTDIRNQVQLAVANTQASSAPAAARMMDNQGFESGLTAIGLELAHGELCLAAIWAMYEKSDQIPTIQYPTQYYLKSPDQIEKEIKQKTTLREEIPSSTFKKEMNKEIVRTSLGPRISQEQLDAILKEIDAAKYHSSDPTNITKAFDSGLVGTATASEALGWPKGEAEQAEKDRILRVAETLKAQSSQQNPAARGAPDLSPAPVQQAAQEKVGQPGRGVAN